MEKIWRPADKILVEIGRFVLLRPVISAMLLLIAIMITILTNNADLFNSAHPLKPITISPRIFNPIITVNQDKQFGLHLASNELPNPAPNLPVIVQTNTVATEPLIEAPTPENPAVVSNQNSSSELAATTQPAHKSNTTWQAFRIHSGDNLVRLFNKYKIDAKDAATLASLSTAKSLKHLKSGQQMLLIIDDQHKLQKLIYGMLNDTESLTLVRNASDTFELEKNQPEQLAEADTSITPLTEPSADLPISTNSQNIASAASSLSYISGGVSKSLVIDARKAGLSAKQANQLAKMFGRQKIQRGDQFSVLLQDDVAKNADDNVVMAQLTHGDKLLQLIRFVTPKEGVGYYTPNGESLNDSILRAPLQYKRISSFFSQSRFHPMLHFFRPHLGVDYAASVGTPIKAAGNGAIAEIERTGGYGNSIVIKHDGKYSTLYAHMSKFASNLHVGSIVQQGQIIGYVGRTGLATGPHLHYEIHVNNVAMNPLTVALPPQSVPSPYRNQFLAQAKILLAQLKSNQPVHLADKGDTIKRS